MIYITAVKSFQFNTTPGIRFGAEESINSAAEVSKKLGKNILFVTDPGLVKIGLIDDTLAALRSHSDVLVFDNVEADPSLKTLMKCVEVGSDFNTTGVIGFGGGSSMDVSKLTALIIGSKEDIHEAWGVAKAKGPRLPLALYPTTSGTGSEVTPISIITQDDQEKKGVSSPIILPDLAILDPLLTLGLPPHTTAAKIPKIATTTRSSIKVNPRLLVVIKKFIYSTVAWFDNKLPSAVVPSLVAHVYT